MPFYSFWLERKAGSTSTFCTGRYLNFYPDVARSGINPLSHYLKIGETHGRLPCPPIQINLSDFQQFTYSRHSHWNFFLNNEVELFGKNIKKNECNLKEYQDLFIFLFIKEHIPNGSSILDIGGGHSRILSYFSKTHQCWNIDKMEGLGDGPIGFFQ